MSNDASNDVTLNEKEELFAQEIAKGATASSAYRRVYSAEDWKGESVHTEASKLKNQPKVLLRIKELQALSADEAIVDASMVLRGLLTEAEWMGEGSSHSARVSAWEKLGKHLGMFTDKVDHTSSDGSMSPPQPLSPEAAKAIDEELEDEY